MNERDLFIDLLQIDSPIDRQASLEQACGGDSSLRKRVEKLLRAHEKGSSLLEAPPPGVDATIQLSSAAEKPGARIDRYKLLEQIGEGGFGVVFMAEQETPVRRKVALKIIKPGMDTKEVIARFEAERQALAMMDHPNIAKVLDAGTTESERPYFVMELIRGVPITEYCDQNNLPAGERLQLFVSVCEAVQHAHQKGILHRDIKPSNVMVTLRDDTPVPKVIDFGVAKAISQRLTEKTLFTRFAQMVGTPLYMSPEQAGMSELDADTRSDIYSLGVLLYELLTGATPFDRERLREAAYDELLRIIREEEPPRPSIRISTLGETASTVSNHRKTDPRHLSQFLRGELDWVVMKALEKDRTRRYETASAFADDIRRYLNDEPVEACPPSTRYLLKKLYRRHRPLFAATALVVVALLLGLIGMGWQAMRATRARDRALTAEARASENLDQALAAVDQMLTRVGDEKLDNVPFLSEVRRDLLEDAAKFYRKLRKGTPDDPRLRLETAMAERRMAQILHHLGRTPEAEKSARRSIELLSDALRESPDDQVLRLELARSRFLAGSISGGTPQFEQAVDLLEQLSASDPSNRAARAELAFGLSRLATRFQGAGDPSAAEKAFSKAEQVYEDLLRGHASDQDLSRSYAKHLQNYGVFFMHAGDWKAAEAKFQKAMEACTTLIALDDGRRQNELVFSAALMNYASTLIRQERGTEADVSFRQAVDIQRKLVRDYPSVPDYRLRLASSLMSFAANFSMLKKPARGLPLAEEAVQVMEYLTDTYPTVAKYHIVHGGELSNMAALLEDLKELERAEQAAARAIDHQHRALRANPENPTANQYLLTHYLMLARIRMLQQRFPETSAACVEGLKVAERLLIRYPNHQPTKDTVEELRELRKAADDRDPKTDGPGIESDPSEPHEDAVLLSAWNSTIDRLRQPVEDP